MSKEDKIKQENKEQKMIKRMVLTLVAVAILGTSALMIQSDKQDTTRGKKDYANLVYNSESTEMDTETSAASIPERTRADEGMIYSSSLDGTMGRDVLTALDESMEQIPKHDDEVDHMLVHKGYLSLQALKGELQSMADAVEELITKDNRGYVESRSSSNQGWNGYDEHRVMDMQFRIQSQFFHETFASIQKLVGQDMVVRVKVISRDVTDSYIDATSRADTLEASMKALKILLERANNVQDVLSVQRELNSLTQQYESHRKRAIHLEKEANYSYLTVFWEEKIPRINVIVKWRPTRALFLAWDHMLALCMLVSDTVIYSLVWLVPLAVAYLVIYTCLKKK